MSDLSAANTASGDDERYTIELPRGRSAGRTALLGNAAGFVLHLPAQLNTRDRTLAGSKWFGASGFGRHYLSTVRLWLVHGDIAVPLDRNNQTHLIQTLAGVERGYNTGECIVRQSFFLPNRIEAAVMTVETSPPYEIRCEPQFDMRYYQTFNSTFDGYSVRLHRENEAQWLEVSNEITGPSATLPQLEFHAAIAAARGDIRIDLFPENERLREKSYLVDEHRKRLIKSAYTETHEESPDEAPIWDQCTTHVFAPAQITGTGTLSLVFGFGANEQDARGAVRKVTGSLLSLHAAKRDDALTRVRDGMLETGIADVDTAYAQILGRFNDCLVARGMTVRRGTGAADETYSAIFAGDKYFLDPWKRDENIALQGLLLTGDYSTVRAILYDTWQFQDQRTGRLPQILRLGEPLVYFSSDGTLWALRRLYQYTRLSGDRSLLEEKYAMVERFFASSLDFVKRGLLPSGRIVDASYLWETWMDTPYTPRDGYPVEIELLWLRALEDYLPTIESKNPTLAQRLRATLEEARETFTLFYLDGYLADSLSYEWEPRTILTPNGYMAFDTGYPLPPALASSMVELGREQLAGQVGVRSLAWRDWPRTLSAEFMADPRNFRGHHMASVGIYNYHRGVEWLWLNQFLLQGELNYGDADHAFDLYVDGLVHETLHEKGIGGLSELYDMHGPLGADFQAWSMAGFIACLHAFAGVDVDAIERQIVVRPTLPRRLPRLLCRRRIGQTAFDLTVHHEAGGIQSIDIAAIDPIRDRASVRLGFQLPVGSIKFAASLDGRPVAQEAIQIQHSDGAGAAIAWIEAPMIRRLAARFSL